jgi:2-methylcitrate dehydratase PrpD
MERRMLAEDFAEFIFKTDYRDIPKEVVLQTKKCLLDFLGVALAGSRVGLAPLIRSLMVAMGGREEATIIGDGRRVSAFHAALINGVAAHTLDMDDGHRFANGHPGIAIIPAALAMGEREDVTGRELIEGLWWDMKFSFVLPPPSILHLRGFHTTGTVGLRAAAACSKILN